MLKPAYTRAFTLIETIIYLALFSIVVGGTLMSSTLLFEGAGRDTTKARLQEEGTFILTKAALSNEVADSVYLQSLTDPSIVVTNSVVATTSSKNLGTTVYSTGVHFTLTTNTRQGRSESQDFFATTTL